MNRIDRVSAILIQLQSKRIVKAQDIADRFGISLRTVYRDISTLYEAGVPIISEAGVGYSLTEGYRLAPVSFTSEEATAFLTAEKLIEKLTDKKTFSHYQSALFKIKSILRTPEKDYISNLENYIEVIENPCLPKRLENDKYITDILKSIATRQIITVQYFAQHSQEQTERSIEPVGIFYSSNHWHLIAYCLLREDYRQFRMDRVKGVSFTDKNFSMKHPSIKEYLNQITQKEKELQTVILRIDKKVVRHIQNQKYYLGYISEIDLDDCIEMTFLTSSLEGFARWFMMFGDSAEIITPSVLKDTIREIAEALLRKL